MDILTIFLGLAALLMALLMALLCIMILVGSYSFYRANQARQKRYDSMEAKHDQFVKRVETRLQR